MTERNSGTGYQSAGLEMGELASSPGRTDTIIKFLLVEMHDGKATERLEDALLLPLMMEEATFQEHGWLLDL